MMIKNKEFTCTLDLRVKPEDDRGGGNSQVGHDRKEEQGRSMVEMLGVLAVVGVLSVGGIAGYTYAMNKHYANELLAGASERAVLLTAQIASGRKPSLKEFANHTTAGGTFATEDESIRVYTDGIGIPVSGVKGAVCENLIKATDGTDILITDIDENEMSADNCAEESNDLLFVFETGIGGAGEETDPACADVECEDGLTCFHGECKCSTGLFVCGTQCCAEGTYCTQGADTSTYTCAEPTGECTKNSDCKDAEGNVDTSKYCKFSGGGCSNPGTGTCTDKGTLTPYTLNLPGGDLTVYKGRNMNWWSAVNFCEAHDKKQLVTMSDLGIADSGTNTDCYFDRSQSSYATAPCICNGGSDSDCSATNAAIRTNTGALGITAGTTGILWLADNSKSNSCRARYVRLDSGAVASGVDRYNARFYPLCR